MTPPTSVLDYVWRLYQTMRRLGLVSTATPPHVRKQVGRLPPPLLPPARPTPPDA